MVGQGAKPGGGGMLLGQKISERVAGMRDLARLLDAAGIDADPRAFRRYGSARRLYHFHVDHAGSY